MDGYHSVSSCSNPYYGTLDLCLVDILSCVKPSEIDRLKRIYTISEITALVQSVQSLKDVVIRPFGSFTSNLYTKWGDLDTSVELSHSLPSFIARNRKINVLRDIMNILRKNGVARNFTFIPRARVPLLKFESNRHNISCDLSVDNHVGRMKSRILLWLSEIDERFRDMVLLTKEWAKAHDINDPKSGTLNSYSLCLLVIFLFQNCKPAILPPLKDIYGGNFCNLTGTWSSIESEIESSCASNIIKFKFFRQKNLSTLSQLLISFFDKFRQIGRLSSEYAICTYTGQLESIESNPTWMMKDYQLIIEDPFERPDNAARAVGPRELSMISEAFISTSQMLSSYSLISDRNALLSNLVRLRISSQLKVGKQSNYTSQPNHETMHYAVSAYMTDDPAEKKSNKSSRLKVGTQNHHISQSNKEKPHYVSSDFTPAEIFGNVSSSKSSQTQNHYTSQSNHEKQHDAISAFMTDDNPVDTKSGKSSWLNVGKQIHHTFRSNQEKHNYISSVFTPAEIFTNKSSESSQLNVGLQNHYIPEGNQDKPQVAFTGFAIAKPSINGLNLKKSHGNLQPASGIQSHYGKSQSPASSQFIHSPVHQSSNFPLEGKVRTQHKYTAEGNSKTPEVAFTGYAVASPPAVSRQSQKYGNAHVQQAWKPRSQNR